MKARFNHALIVAAVALLAAGGARAGQGSEAKPVGVVELFTSQGCNSCPPADRALERMVEDGDVIALGYHVDYWDYLGWKDTLASGENTERQYEYAKALKRRGVYTPQAVVNGNSHLNGGHYSEIRDRLRADAASGKGLRVDVAAHYMDDRMRVEVRGDGGDVHKANLVIVYYKESSQVPIKRGENAGKTLTYVNAVIDVQTIGMWDGKAMTVDIPETEFGAMKADGCAVLLQSTTQGGFPGPIIGAAILPRRNWK